MPYRVGQLSFGAIKQENVSGVYDGPFPWENAFGFHLAGMVGHDFFKPYAVTFDFENMRIFLQDDHDKQSDEPRGGTHAHLLR